MEIIDVLCNIMRDVFEVDLLRINAATTANDIEEWDSINHIYMIVEVEKKFKIKFTSREIQVWKNVGDIVASIEQKIPSDAF